MAKGRQFLKRTPRRPNEDENSVPFRAIPLLPLPRLVIRRQSSFPSTVDKDLRLEGGERGGMRIDIGRSIRFFSAFFPFLRFFYPKLYIYIYTIDDYIFLKHSPANDEIPPDTKKKETFRPTPFQEAFENPRLHLFP